MREAQLTELQGTSILTKSFFNKLIRRIECTKPLSGNGITVQEEENGYKLTIGEEDGAGGAGDGNFSLINITVCKNGSPVGITVLGKQ